MYADWSVACWDLMIYPMLMCVVVLVSAGFDAALGDPLGGCCVTTDYPNGGFATMTRLLSQSIPSVRYAMSMNDLLKIPPMNE